MKKFLLSKSHLFIISLLVVSMIATTAVSYAYWKSGIEGNKVDTDFNVTIGQGNTITTFVTLGTTDKTNKKLIPMGIAITDANTETHSITITAQVKWQSDLIGDPNSSLTTSHVGQLSVECTSILLGGTQLVDATGINGLSLFYIECTPVDINGNDTSWTDISFNIRMNEPVDRDQYNLISGQALQFGFTFTVLSPYEMGQ